MTSLLDDALLPTDAPGLCAEIADIEQRQADCLARIHDLMCGEDPARGVFHAAAIHETKQTKMMLQYQKDLRTARLNQLKMSQE